MSKKSIQEFYPDDVAQCYGCGRANEHGLQLKSYWDGDETVGGLIASLIDCHGTGTAAAAAYRAAGREMGTEPAFRFVTASLKVDYLRPTPLGPPLEVRGTIKEVKGRKVVVGASVMVEGEICARGEVIAVQMPEQMLPGGR